MFQGNGTIVEFCDRPVNPEWDMFISALPGVSHEQTSLWGVAQGTWGWESTRVIMRRRDRIVGGVQILLLRVPLIGKFGYVQHGPCLEENNEEDLAFMVSEIKRFAISRKLQYLKVDLPYNLIEPVKLFRDSGFTNHPAKLPPEDILRSTLLLDLTPGLDEIMAKIKPGKRKSIRVALKQGIGLRVGTRDDIPTLYDLVMQTCDRRKTKPLYPSVDYFFKLWDLFSPHGWVSVHVAESGGKAACAAMSFTFGDTFRSSVWGWSSEFAHLNASEVMDWETITQAKEAGFRYYDFVHLDEVVAKALLSGEQVPEEIKRRPHYGPTFYKMRFGGNVIFYPGSYTFFPSRAKRVFFTWCASKVLTNSFVRRVIRFMRRGGPSNRFLLLVCHYPEWAFCPL